MTIVGRGSTAGVVQTVHFAVEDRTSALNATVVSAANHLSIEGQDRTDWNTTFGEALPCFGNCEFEKLTVRAEWKVAHRSTWPEITSGLAL